MPLGERERISRAIVAAVEPLIVKRAVAAAFRQAAEWDGIFGDSLLATARAVEALTEENDVCCPVCEETTCDDGCPLAPVRNRWQANAEPRPRLISETETASCYQIWHHGRLVVPEVDLAKPTGPGDLKLYCREIAPGKYNLGWELPPRPASADSAAS
jgi:hypothetical protein